MGPRPPSLAARLSPRSRARRCAVARLGRSFDGNRRSDGRLLDRDGLQLGLGLIRKVDVLDLLAEPCALALGELRLALLQDDEERRRDEDRRVRTGKDSHHEREREVLERVAAEEEERRDREERDERRCERTTDRLPERLVRDRR